MRRYPARPVGRHTGWSPGRDRAAQARMRRALLARADGRCENCGNTHDLRATHITPVRDGGGYGPENGRLLCRSCDLKTDRHAR